MRHEFRQGLGELLADVTQRTVSAAGNEPRQIGGHRADRGRDRHVVVIEDDDKARIHRTRIVHRFISHAGGHRAVTDDADDIVIFAFEVTRDRHAEASRY